ncbi:hypothetical protein CMV_001318 [Castanea mollissima]|uniref:Uncharacterized protein n=1 Tax=Castanea mollissima TaxID=60419 RepID=A0A8J4S2N2_9ROSI|nr:hypothetical protein CMV_001318 [Castanea mollissima]
MTRDTLSHAGIWVENSSTQDKGTLIARKRSPSEIGSFDESARLIHYFSLIFFEWSLPQGLQDLQKDFALRLY